MAEKTYSHIEVTLPQVDRVQVFQEPKELRRWVENEAGKWGHVLGNGAIHEFHQLRDRFAHEVPALAHEWEHLPGNDEEGVRRIQKRLQAHLKDVFVAHKMILSESPAGKFVLGLQEEIDAVAAIGAYAVLVDSSVNFSNRMEASLVIGMIRAFLYKNKVEWSAPVHEKVFDELRGREEEHLEAQKNRLHELDQKTQALHADIENEIRAHTERLGVLHDEQAKKFDAALADGTKALKAVEDTYDKKLALQRPIKYWELLAKRHGKLAKIFGWVSLGIGIVALGSLIVLAFTFFGNLGQDESPEHWQFAVLLIAAFFSVWIVRIFVRLFFSNLHLATDATERRMMILTFVTMAREGKNVAPDDRKLIFQHIFRSASDGLVKDDAAPPGWMEMFTRK
jgi:hypothetical protein